MLYLYFREIMLPFHPVIPRIRNNYDKVPGTQYVFQKLALMRDALANIKYVLTYLSLFNAAVCTSLCSRLTVHLLAHLHIPHN